jgi:hypothetical protein
MKKVDPAFFHRIYGQRRPRLAYVRTDFADYALMTALCGLVISLAYGPLQPLSVVGWALCVYMMVSFPLRHGWGLRAPAIVKRPRDVLYMLMYKLQNMRAAYFVGAAILVLENYLIYLTPTLPHHTALLRYCALSLFYVHLAVLTAYRTAILLSHLRRKDHVREFLLQTPWKSVVADGRSVTFEIWHAYFTGLLTHLLLIAPWYIMITHVKYSLVFLPLAVVANLIVHSRFMRVLNDWFYRDHWLGHNSELEFLYLHGPHHDAIPSGLIGVSGTGYLEGVARHTLGGPGIFYSPFLTFLAYTLEVKADIDGHQFIPGVYPHVPKSQQEINQHSTHHFLRLEPYSLGLNVERAGVSEEVRRKYRLLSPEMKNSVQLDETLNGFQWDNPKYHQFLKLYDKYLSAGVRD